MAYQNIFQAIFLFFFFRRPRTKLQMAPLLSYIDTFSDTLNDLLCKDCLTC